MGSSQDAPKRPRTLGKQPRDTDTRSLHHPTQKPTWSVTFRKTAPSGNEAGSAASDARNGAERRVAPGGYVFKNRRGMKNWHTAHMRRVMFGQFANRRSAGAKSRPTITEEAAVGRLFQTVTNVALDVSRYDNGYDSDDDDERTGNDCISRAYDERLFEVCDDLAIEKYFFSLWNEFIRMRDAVFDHDLASAWKQFLAEFGIEVKRMKMEALAAYHVVHCWCAGLLEADGIMSVLRALRDCCVPSASTGEPPRNCTIAHRLLGEARQNNDLFDIRDAQDRMDAQDRDAERWFIEERKKFRQGQPAGQVVDNGLASADSWMSAMIPDDLFEPLIRESQT